MSDLRKVDIIIGPEGQPLIELPNKELVEIGNMYRPAKLEDAKDGAYQGTLYSRVADRLFVSPPEKIMIIEITPSQWVTDISFDRDDVIDVDAVEVVDVKELPRPRTELTSGPGWPD